MCRGNFVSKSINVQTKIRPCRGNFFSKFTFESEKKAYFEKKLHFPYHLMLEFRKYARFATKIPHKVETLLLNNNYQF